MTTNTVTQQEQVKQSKQSSDKNKDTKKERFIINPVDGTLVTGGRKQYLAALAGAR